MAAATPPAPVEETQRIALLDMLRGFSVLGILLANMPWMGLAGVMAAPPGSHIGGDRLVDSISHAFVYLFADTKFLTLFSTLFGAGLALMSERALRAGAPFAARYARRLGVLLLFGLAHALLLWFGDILVAYALLGGVAMWFRRCRLRTLLVVALVLLALNALLFAALGLVDPAEFVDRRPDQSLAEAIEATTVRYRTTWRDGSFAEMTALRAETFGWVLLEMTLVMGMRTLALFLLGIALIRSGGLSRLTMDRRLLLRAAATGLGVGLLLQSISLAVEYDADAAAILRMLGWTAFYCGGLAMAVGYAAAVALWTHTNLALGLRARLAAVGRMALTNYLSHSLMTSALFQWLGYYDEWRRPGLLVLVFAIFGAQLCWSPIWLRHFHFGPAEWLWRMATYGRALPIRR